jgi:hypothetical protein
MGSRPRGVSLVESVCGIGRVATPRSERSQSLSGRPDGGNHGLGRVGRRSSDMPTGIVECYLNRHPPSLTHPVNALPHSCLAGDTRARKGPDDGHCSPSHSLEHLLERAHRGRPSTNRTWVRGTAHSSPKARRSCDRSARSEHRLDASRLRLPSSLGTATALGRAQSIVPLSFGSTTGFL